MTTYIHPDHLHHLDTLIRCGIGQLRHNPISHWHPTPDEVVRLSALLNHFEGVVERLPDNPDTYARLLERVEGSKPQMSERTSPLRPEQYIPLARDGLANAAALLAAGEYHQTFRLLLLVESWLLDSAVVFGFPEFESDYVPILYAFGRDRDSRVAKGEEV